MNFDSTPQPQTLLQPTRLKVLMLVKYHPGMRETQAPADTFVDVFKYGFKEKLPQNEDLRSKLGRFDHFRRECEFKKQER